MRDDLDRLIDDALSEYRNAEPLAGLPERVVERLGSQSSPRRAPFVWVGTAIAAAVLVVVVWIAVPRQRVPEVRKGVDVPVEQATLIVPVPVRVPELSLRRVYPVRRAVERPSEFPTPAPLSSEERLLIAFARAGGQMSDVDATKPVVVEPVVVKPFLVEEN